MRRYSTAECARIIGSNRQTVRDQGERLGLTPQLTGNGRMWTDEQGAKIAAAVRRTWNPPRPTLADPPAPSLVLDGDGLRVEFEPEPASTQIPAVETIAANPWDRGEPIPGPGDAATEEGIEEAIRLGKAALRLAILAAVKRWL